jgi:hypothetical protein
MTPYFSSVLFCSGLLPKWKCKLLLFCFGIVRLWKEKLLLFCSVLAFCAGGNRSCFCSLLFYSGVLSHSKEKLLLFCSVQAFCQVEMEATSALFRDEQSVQIEKLFLFCSGVRSHWKEKAASVLFFFSRFRRHWKDKSTLFCYVLSGRSSPVEMASAFILFPSVQAFCTNGNASCFCCVLFCSGVLRQWT